VRFRALSSRTIARLRSTSGLDIVSGSYPSPYDGQWRLVLRDGSQVFIFHDGEIETPEERDARKEASRALFAFTRERAAASYSPEGLAATKRMKADQGNQWAAINQKLREMRGWAQFGDQWEGTT
jgi:hypothetical protein